jgi:hypothetical protein
VIEVHGSLCPAERDSTRSPRIFYFHIPREVWDPWITGFTVPSRRNLASTRPSIWQSMPHYLSRVLHASIQATHVLDQVTIYAAATQINNRSTSNALCNIRKRKENPVERRCKTGQLQPASVRSLGTRQVVIFMHIIQKKKKKNSKTGGI